MFLTPSTTLNIFDDYLIHKKNLKEKKILRKRVRKNTKEKMRKIFIYFFLFSL